MICSTVCGSMSEIASTVCNMRANHSALFSNHSRIPLSLPTGSPISWMPRISTRMLSQNSSSSPPASSYACKNASFSFVSHAARVVSSIDSALDMVRRRIVSFGANLYDSFLVKPLRIRSNCNIVCTAGPECVVLSAYAIGKVFPCGSLVCAAVVPSFKTSAANAAASLHPMVSPFAIVILSVLPSSWYTTSSIGVAYATIVAFARSFSSGFCITARIASCLLVCGYCFVTS